jgi:nucleoside-diphosphate-sugar epimerase
VKLFCFGLGYAALAVARRFEGPVSGTVRSREKQAALAAAGIEAQLFETARVPADATHILVSVPPDAEGDPVLRRFPSLGAGWVGYLSTTGVYGDTGGAAVDEAAPLAPSGPRQRARVAAEGAWRATGLPLHIFRLAGIYGPGRSALDQVRAGTAKRIDRPGHVFSRIHVEDAASALLASMARPDPGAVYNLCDDEPAEPQAVVAEACRLLGVAPPPLIALDAARLSPMARSFWTDDRRVSNARMKRALGVTLSYPTYREGLRALLDDAPEPRGTRQCRRPPGP